MRDWQIIYFVTLLFIAALWVAPASAQQAGEQIVNQARVTFNDVNTNQTVLIKSAEVSATRTEPKVELIFIGDVNLQNPSPGDDLMFEFDISNKGTEPAQSVDVLVDGSMRSFVLFENVMPRNTIFKGFAPTEGDMVNLVHYAGEGDNNFHPVEPGEIPENGREIDKIAIGIESIKPDEAYSINFEIGIDTLASGGFETQGKISYKENGDQKEERSNKISVDIDEMPPQIGFFTSDKYTEIIKSENIGNSLLVQGIAATCNTNPLLSEIVDIRISSLKTNDEELFLAKEIGRNAPIFRIVGGVVTADVGDQSSEKGNNVIETTTNDTLFARIASCGSENMTATTDIIIEPFGVVFNSITNEPVGGAEVTLMPQVNSNDKVGNSVSSERIVITNENGQFVFKNQRSGIYQINVKPPGNLSFPSEVAPEDLAATRRVRKNNSYGFIFIHNNDDGPITVDIPVDESAEDGLSIRKQASARNVTVGDFLDYSIDIINDSGRSLDGVVVNDTLPDGFKYVRGTARINDEAISGDSVSVNGPAVTFNVGDLSEARDWKLTYRVEIRAAAMNGDGINVARARSSGLLPKVSNVSRTQTEVRGGVFSDKGFILGKVYLDANANREQDDGEPGIPGVRLVMENGNFVITDNEGLYSLYGIEPETHVLKIDPLSLPKGARLIALDNRFAGDPGSRFVDLAKGNVHKADFAVCNCDEGIREEIENRRKNWEAPVEYDQAISKRLTIENPARINIKNKPSQGYKDGAKQGTEKASNLDLQHAIRNQSPDSTEAAIDLNSLENKFGLIGLSDGDTLASAQTSIRVASRYGTRLKMEINGEAVPEKKVGTQSIIKDQDLQVFEYYGIELRRGENEIILKEYDTFNNLREERSLRLVAPGKIAGLRMETDRGELPADGVSMVHLKMKMIDEEGIPVKSDQTITLKVSGGSLNIIDENKEQEGIQTTLKGIEKSVAVIAPRIPGELRIEASAGRFSEAVSINVLPDLRPLLGVGIVEGTINLQNGSVLQSGERDGFYKEIREFAYTSKDGRFNTGARGSIYLKGKVLGKYLLTLTFNSEKEDDEPLFRDIQPDEFYPVYGDASIRGFDAQSSGKLYVRLDRGRSFLQYGDYQTQVPHPAVELGRYNRSQTGFKGRHETDRLFISTYGTVTSSQQVIEEFDARGTSGPFFLENNIIVENSEQVEIITRDRNQSGEILASKRLIPFQDYTIDEFTGSLILKQPVPSFDTNLNPNFIRVSYEVEQGGEDYFSGGSNAYYKISKGLEAGVSIVQDENPEESFNLQSTNITAKLTENTYLIGEVARSGNEDESQGYAGRLNFEHGGDRLTLNAHALESEETFENPSALLRQSNRELGVDAGYDISRGLGVIGQYEYTEDEVLNVKSSGGLAGLQATIQKVQLELAMRYTKAETFDTTATATFDTENTTLRGKIRTAVPGVSKLDVYGEYEQEVSDINRRIIGAGANYRIGGVGKIYARHEFISSLGNQYTLNDQRERNVTMLGIDANYSKNGEVFSEYRVRDAFSGREAQASIGLRNRWEIADGLFLNSSLERITRNTNSTDSESYSATGALQYTGSPDWKGSTRIEFRFANDAFSYLNTSGIGYRLSREWTLLARNLAVITNFRDQRPTKVQNRSRVGFAYRDINTSVWNGLFLYEYKYEQNTSFGTGNTRRGVHIGSTNVNIHPARDLTFTVHGAAKKVNNRDDSIDTDAINYLLSARSLLDIGKRWDTGIQGSLFTDGKFESQRFGLGAEVGYRVAKNLRLALGYNVFGFSDRDFNDQVRTQQGPFAKMSFKFDERIFGRLLPESRAHSDYPGPCECREKTTQRPAKRMPVQTVVETAGVPIVEPEAWQIYKLENVILPRNIHFATDEAEIDNRSALLLNRLASYLITNTSATITLEGHTDDVDTDDYNYELSLRRVNSIGNYLESAGISKERIKKIASGESSPYIKSTGNVERAFNRRVEIVIDGDEDVLLKRQKFDLKISGELQNGTERERSPLWLDIPVFSIHRESRVTQKIKKANNE